MAGIPQTIWRPTSGNGEAITTTVSFLVDELGNNLVDTTGVFIIDTGTDFTTIPNTVWSVNDGQ